MLPLRFSDHELAEQIVTGMLAPVGNQVGQISPYIDYPALRLFQNLDAGPVDALEGQDIVGPLFEILAVLRRDAKDFGHDKGR